MRFEWADASAEIVCDGRIVHGQTQRAGQHNAVEIELFCASIHDDVVVGVGGDCHFDVVRRVVACIDVFTAVRRGLDVFDPFVLGQVAGKRSGIAGQRNTSHEESN